MIYHIAVLNARRENKVKIFKDQLLRIKIKDRRLNDEGQLFFYLIV